MSGNASSFDPGSVDDASTPEDRAPVRLAPEDTPPACTIHPAPPPMERRGFLVWLAGIVLAVGGILMGATVVQALVPPARSIDGKTKVGKLVVGTVAELQVGKPVLANYGDVVLYLVKKSATQVSVLSQTCPHVGCKLAFNTAKKQFDCPCHASSFSLDGVKLGGPAPRNMYSADFEITNGQIVVSGVPA